MVLSDLQKSSSCLDSEERCEGKATEKGSVPTDLMQSAPRPYLRPPLFEKNLFQQGRSSVATCMSDLFVINRVLET